MKTELIHKFNQVTLGIDKELEELFDKEINLFLTPLEVEENAVVSMVWDASGGPNMCPLCSHLNGQRKADHTADGPQNRFKPLWFTHQGYTSPLSDHLSD